MEVVDKRPPLSRDGICMYRLLNLITPDRGWTLVSQICKNLAIPEEEAFLVLRELQDKGYALIRKGSVRSFRGGDRVAQTVAAATMVANVGSTPTASIKKEGFNDNGNRLIRYAGCEKGDY